MDFSESTVCCIKSFVTDLVYVQEHKAHACTGADSHAIQKTLLDRPPHLENFLKRDFLPRNYEILTDTNRDFDYT
jgi:hypothetical protein